MIDLQNTLADVAEVEGVGLFFGQSIRLRFLPADANTGVVFVRTDMTGRPEIPACIDTVVQPERWTGLKRGDAEVRMVEHVLAALAGMGIDNAVVEADAPEMPVGDGSARTFTDAFINAGIRELDEPAHTVKLDGPVAITDDDELVLAAVPRDEGMTITYVLDYGDLFIGRQTLTLSVEARTFAKQIAPARTYVLRPEVDYFIQRGMGKGATPENTIILEQNGDISVPLRLPNECVRHKILDVVGDLSLIGGRISARLIGYKTGHRSNIRLAQAIHKACSRGGAVEPQKTAQAG